MAQVMVNFRIDETIKKSMEQACKEMGMSMTTAFTIFATKVSREKRIPFEITAEPSRPPIQQRLSCRRELQPGCEEEKAVLARKQEQLELLCVEIRRSLTAIHTAIPSSITGLSMEQIRLLCGVELKDKTAGIAGAVRSLSSSRNAETLQEKDTGILEEYLDGLSSIAAELKELENALVPAMKSWSGGDTGGFEPYERRLAAVSKEFDALPAVMQRFLHSTARKQGSARAFQARIQAAAQLVETAYVLTALENLEALVLRHYDSLEGQTKAHLESHYLPTLERTLRELSLTERNGEDGSAAALCLRTVNVLSQVIHDQQQARQALGERSLEAEVAALERLAALRGDIAGSLKPD